MIENRMRIERKILRGRLDVKRASRARGDKTPVEGSSEPSNNLQAALSSTAINNADNSSGGAGHTDFESSYPFPAFLASELIAVESDREAGFVAGSERFFKRSHGSGRAHRRSVSHGLAQIQVPPRSDLPDITIQPNSPEASRQSSRDYFATVSSPIRRRRWGSSLSNVFSLADPATAPLPRSDEVALDRQTTQMPVSATETVRPKSFLARLRSTSFNALTSPLSRIGSSVKEPDARSVGSPQLQEAGWSSDSSSEDEFIWNGDQTAPVGISSFAMEIGDEEEVAWGAGQNIRGQPREDEDADLTGEIPESP
jgi:hypothetical protein